MLEKSERTVKLKNAAVIKTDNQNRPSSALNRAVFFVGYYSVLEDCVQLRFPYSPDSFIFKRIIESTMEDFAE